ncbi:MAG: ParB/RepB/Spo0J family partition protein [Candidatus Thorarchaeota archaeon]
MKFEEITIDKIKILENIRQRQTDSDSAPLMRDIKQNGLIQPIGVKKNNGTYTLIHGYRRLSACKKLGWKTITARIIFDTKDQMDEKEFFVLNTVENIQRNDINMFELGRIIGFFKKTYNMSNSEIAARLSIPLTRVKNANETFKRLPAKFRYKIALVQHGESKKGRIPISLANHVAKMRSLTSQKQREVVLDWIAANDNITTEKLAKLNALLTSGVTFKAAIKKIERLKGLSLKLIVNKEKFDELTKDGTGVAQIVKQALREKYGEGLVY